MRPEIHGSGSDDGWWISDGWVTVTTRQKGTRGQEGEQACVRDEVDLRQGQRQQKVTLQAIASPTMKEIKWKVPGKVKHRDDDRHVRCQGKLLRNRDVVKDCGVYVGSTLYVMDRLRGGRAHRKEKHGEQKRKNMQARRTGPARIVLDWSDAVSGAIHLVFAV